MLKVKRIRVESSDRLSRHIPAIQSIIKGGGVIAFPTDTFYGLGADPFQEKAVEKVFLLKKRPANKPLIALASCREQIESLTEGASDETERLMKRFWPGPLTLALKGRRELPSIMTGGGHTLGVRIPGNDLSRALLDKSGPLTAPSANPHECREPVNADEVEEYFGNELDLIIDGGTAPGDKSSTLLDMTLNPPVLLREGAIPVKELESALGYSVGKPS